MTEKQAAPEMVFDGASKVLLDALTLVGPAVSKKSYVFVTQGVWCEAAEGRVALRATNLSAGIHVSIPAITVQPGQTVIPHRQLSDFLRVLGKDGALRVSVTGSKATITAEGAKAKIDCYAADEFPTEPALGEQITEIPANILATAMGLVFPAISDDTLRPTLCAACVELGPDGVTLAAADGSRLHVVRLTDARAGVAPRKLLFPKENVPALIKLLDPHGGPVALHLAGSGSSQLAFVQGDRTFTGNLVEGSFPNYHRFIPTSFARTLTAPAGEWGHAIGVASVYCDTGHSLLYFTLPASTEAGRAELDFGTRVDITSESKLTLQASAGDKIEGCVNYRYIGEAIAELPADTVVEMGWNSGSTPLQFKASMEGLEYIGIVMPMHKDAGR